MELGRSRRSIDFTFIIVIFAIIALGAASCGCPSHGNSGGRVSDDDDDSGDDADDDGGGVPDDTGDDDGDDDSATESCPDAGLPLDELTLPEGFRICVYAQVEAARSLARGSNGTIFVGTRTRDKVHALRDEDGDGVAERVVVVAGGLNLPNGVAVLDEDLYIAETSRILRLPNIEDRIDNPPAPEIIRDDLPEEEAHGWKFIAFGPDRKLYVPIGAPCNICEPDPPFASILRMDPDGSNPETFAKGIRNTVGFDWDPETDELWFTDNGRDLLGDDIPNDELNHAPQMGLHFGYPYCHEGDLPDPEYGDAQHPCKDYTAPALKLGPHVAALGMRFYDGGMFPAKYRHRIFNAQHGSWNRTVPIGYRVMSIEITGDVPGAYEVFVEGWLRGDETYWGRPVDVLVMPDGALLISDDYASVVYRVSYVGMK